MTASLAGPQLKKREIILLNALRVNVDANGELTASYEELSRLSGLSKQTLWGAVADLESREGLLSHDRRSWGSPNTYVLNLSHAWVCNGFPE